MEPINTEKRRKELREQMECIDGVFQRTYTDKQIEDILQNELRNEFQKLIANIPLSDSKLAPIFQQISQLNIVKNLGENPFLKMLSQIVLNNK